MNGFVCTDDDWFILSTNLFDGIEELQNKLRMRRNSTQITNNGKEGDKEEQYMEYIYKALKYNIRRHTNLNYYTHAG